MNQTSNDFSIIEYYKTFLHFSILFFYFQELSNFIPQHMQSSTQIFPQDTQNDNNENVKPYSQNSDNWFGDQTPVEKQQQRGKVLTGKNYYYGPVQPKQIQKIPRPQGNYQTRPNVMYIQSGGNLKFIKKKQLLSLGSFYLTESIGIG